MPLDLIKFSEQDRSPLPIVDRARPAIDLQEVNPRERISEAWHILRSANKRKAFFFFHAGRMVWPEIRGGLPTFVDVTLDRMTYALTWFIDWIIVDNDGNVEERDVPQSTARGVLAEPDKGLPVVRRIVSVPVFGSDGKLITSPGYYSESQLLFWPSSGLKLLRPRDEPTKADVRNAVDLLYEMVVDFPFKTTADRANTIAALIVSFIRELIDGPVPLFVFGKPTPGTGATLLVQVIAYVVMGVFATGITEARSEEEWARKILAALRRGWEILIIDNVVGKLKSAALASMVSTDQVSDRVVRTSNVETVEASCAVFVTGNNLQMSPELARRTVPIDLDAGVERPEFRVGFQHPNLRSWVRENRDLLIWAVYILVQNWTALGCPKGSRKFGGFESWTEITGGILEAAGIPGFLDNFDETRDIRDDETPLIASFVDHWWQIHGSNRLRAGELLNLAEGNLDITGSTRHALTISLGKLLTTHRDKCYGSFFIRDAGLRSGSRLWRLERASEASDKTKENRG